MENAVKVSEDIELVDTIEDNNPITDDVQANNALLSIMHRREETKRWKEHYKEQADKIRVANEQFEAFQTARLQRYFQTVPHKETKTQSNYTLMDGKLIFKDQQPEYDLDEPALIEWLKSSGMSEYVKVTEKVDWVELKKTIVVDNGSACSAITGEVIPAIKVTEHKDRLFTISVK